MQHARGLKRLLGTRDKRIRSGNDYCLISTLCVYTDWRSVHLLRISWLTWYTRRKTDFGSADLDLSGYICIVKDSGEKEGGIKSHHCFFYFSIIRFAVIKPDINAIGIPPARLL
jgi:hypothetical protein